MSDCGFNNAGRDAIIYMSLYFFLTCLRLLKTVILTFFFSLYFSGPPSKENACRLLTKENIILNAIKMLEINLKIIGNDIKAEIIEE